MHERIHASLSYTEAYQSAGKVLLFLHFGFASKPEHKWEEVIGEIPILAYEQKLLDKADTGIVEGEEKEKPKEGGGRPKVLADGTYTSEMVFTSSGAANLEAIKAASKPPLRSTQTTHYWPLPLIVHSHPALILGGDFFTGAVLAASLTKLVPHDKVACNTLRAEVGTISSICHPLPLMTENFQPSLSQETKIQMSA